MKTYDLDHIIFRQRIPKFFSLLSLLLFSWLIISAFVLLIINFDMFILSMVFFMTPFLLIYTNSYVDKRVFFYSRTKRILRLFDGDREIMKINACFIGYDENKFLYRFRIYDSSFDAVEIPFFYRVSVAFMSDGVFNLRWIYWKVEE